MSLDQIFSQSETLKIFLAAAMMLIGVFDDVKNQKVHNKLVIAFFIISFLVVFLLDGSAGLFVGLASLVTAILFGVPVYMLKVFAGGDLKILIAISPLLLWKNIIILLLSSFFWGAILGVLFVVLKGNYKQFLANMYLLVSKTKPQANLTHKIPYTVALFFGLLTVWTLNSTGGFL